MTQKHTPGPWHTGGRDGQIVYAAGGWAVASFTVYHGRHREGEGAANAALGAAAPELLAVARECLDAERQRRAKLLPGAPATTYSDARIARIEAAISKAEGR